MKVGLGPDDIVLDGDLAPHTERGTATIPPTFRPMSIVAKLSPISANNRALVHYVDRHRICGINTYARC